MLQRWEGLVVSDDGERIGHDCFEVE